MICIILFTNGSTTLPRFKLVRFQVVFWFVILFVKIHPRNDLMVNMFIRTIINWFIQMSKKGPPPPIKTNPLTPKQQPKAPEKKGFNP